MSIFSDLVSHLAQTAVHVLDVDGGVLHDGVDDDLHIPVPRLPAHVADGDRIGAGCVS